MEKEKVFTLDDMISFGNWYEKLGPVDKCTVWPPAGSGSGHGLYMLEMKYIIERWEKLHKPKKQDEAQQA